MVLRNKKTLSAALLSAYAALAAVHVVRAAEEQPVETVNVCAVDITHVRRPMYTEKEMDRYHKSFATCLELIYHDSDPPDLEYIEVANQTWTPGESGGRGRRKLGRGGNKVLTRVKCRSCKDETLIPDRRLASADASGNEFPEEEELELDLLHEQKRHEDRRMLTTADLFDQCLLRELSDGVGGDDDDLEAFYFDPVLTTVTTSCSLDVETHHQAVVLATSDGTFDIVDELICETRMEGAVAPILSDAEYVRFDTCMIQCYNDLYYVEPTHPLMVRNEISAQDPNGAVFGGDQARRRGLGELSGPPGGMQRRLAGRNTVSSRTGVCRNCEGEKLSTRQRRRSLLLSEEQSAHDRKLLLSPFHPDFLSCLTAPPLLDAFSGPDFSVTTECDEPLSTQSELVARQAESSELFKARQHSDKEKFMKRWDDEDRRIKAAMEEHELHRKEFDFEQKVEEEKHKAVTEAYFAEQMERLQKTCVIPRGKMGTCDSRILTNLPKDFVTVTEAKTLTAKFALNQKFAYDPISTKCKENMPGFEDVHFLAKFAKDYDDEYDVIEYDCKDEKAKCDEKKEFESKKCYWNGDSDVQRMVADVEIAVWVRDLGVEPLPALGEGRNRALRSSQQQRGLDESMCGEAKDAARLGGGEYCVMEFMIDCNCQYTS